MNSSFRVALTRDFLKSDGTISFGDIGLDRLDKTPGITWEFLDKDNSPILAEQLNDYDALLLLGSEISAESISNNNRLALIARFGVGYDNVNIKACTEKGILVSVTPNGVRKPVAIAGLTYILALSQKMFQRDAIVRSGRWHERMDNVGIGLNNRTIGLIGLGNIGRELCGLLQNFGVRILASDPNSSAYLAGQSGAELVDLESLLTNSDFIILCCELNPQTHHLIDEKALQSMKKSSYIINIARGSIIDQKALTFALQEGIIAGAGLDVFEQEPINPQDPLLQLNNIIVSPHGLGWTDECFTSIGRNAVAAICRLATGRLPEFIVNHEAARHISLREKLRLFASNAVSA